MLNRIISKVSQSTISKYANQLKIIWYYDNNMLINKILATITIITEQAKGGYFLNT